MPLKILWNSDRIIGGHSAYSKITYECCTRLAKMGHSVAHIPMGNANMMGDQVHEGVLVFRSGANVWNEDVIIPRYIDFKADMVISLKEPWVFNSFYKFAINSVPYAIIDHSPVSPEITSRLHNAFKILVPSRFAQRELRTANIENVTYVPHGVRTDIYKPLEGHKEDCKKLWYMEPDDFTVLMISMNRSRKMNPRAFRGYKRFLELNPDVKSHLMFWGDVRPRAHARGVHEGPVGLGVSDVGVNLLPEILNLDLGKEIAWPDSKMIGEGVPEWTGENYISGWDMVKLYNMADVLLFCMPGNTNIFCESGPKEISNINLKDKVLTHNGYFKKVTKNYSRHYNGEIIEITPMYGMPLSLTPEHPVLAIKTKKCYTNRGICKKNCNIIKYSKKIKKHNEDSERVTKYNEAMKLREEKKWGYRKIAKKIGINKNSVAGWIYRGQKPWGLHGKGCKQRYYENYLLEWIPANNLKEWDYVVLPRLKNESTIDNIKISDYVDVYEENGLVYGIGKNQYGSSFKHPSSKPIKNIINLNNNMVKLMGYYVAEGCANDDGLMFSIATYEKEIDADIESIIKKEFGLNVTRQDQTRHRRIIKVYSSILGRFFRKIFGDGARQKKLPSWLFKLPEPKIWYLIQGMWRGDGYLSRNKNKISYSTTSPVLAYQLWMILSKYGFISSIKYNDRKRAYRIRISGKQLENILKNMQYKFKPSRNKESFNYGYVDENYIYVPILKIDKKPFNDLVYNLGVEDDESYTGHFTIHNCTGGEGFGLPLIEAQACGVPVVATDYAAAPEQVGAGLTVKADDYVIINTPGVRRALTSIDGMANAITKIMNHDPEKLKRRARRFAMRYDWDKIMERYFKPFLDESEEELKPLLTKKGVGTWA